MNGKKVNQVLEGIGSLTNDEQVLLVRQIRTVLNPPAQMELSERGQNGF